MTKNQRKTIWIIAGIMTVVSVVVMYMTHREVPFMMDDLWYSTMLSNDTPIASFGDIIESQIWHYHNWGGRSILYVHIGIFCAFNEFVEIFYICFLMSPVMVVDGLLRYCRS